MSGVKRVELNEEEVRRREEMRRQAEESERQRREEARNALTNAVTEMLALASKLAAKGLKNLERIAQDNTAMTRSRLASETPVEDLQAAQASAQATTKILTRCD